MHSTNALGANLSPTIFFIDDEPALHDWMLKVSQSIGIAMESSLSGADFLQTIAAGRPGCVVSDIRMPGMQGLEVQRKMKEMNVALPVIFLSAHADIETAVEAMRRGAFDFLEKPVREQLLIERIHAALDEDLISREAEAAKRSILKRMNCMTGKEREVLDRIVAGMANKAIAGELGISEKTVEYRRARLMSKAGVRSVPQLVQLALSFNRA